MAREEEGWISSRPLHTSVSTDRQVNISDWGGRGYLKPRALPPIQDILLFMPMGEELGVGHRAAILTEQ